MASPEHADREQAREAIDALAGVVDLLVPLSPPDEVEALRRDLSQLRMAFVQTAEASAAPAEPARRRAGAAPEADAAHLRRRRGWPGSSDLDARRRRV